MSVSQQRWLTAQEAERSFWVGAGYDPARVAAIVSSMTAAAQWAQGRLPSGDGAEWVEVGVGPLGIGVAHFLRASPERTRIVGVDPIEFADAGVLPDPLAMLVERCHVGYEHVVARGEETGLESDRFEAAFLNNMLDHVASPLDVLAETRRVLAPGGHLLLTCDVFSTAGRVKHKTWNRARYSDSLLVRAHPHRFSQADLMELVTQAGFAIRTCSRDDDRWQRAIGRAADVYFHAVRVA